MTPISGETRKLMVDAGHLWHVYHVCIFILRCVLIPGYDFDKYNQECKYTG